MIRRKFLADRLPANIDKFDCTIITEWPIDVINCIEKNKDDFKVTFCDGSRIVVNDADKRVVDKFIVQNGLTPNIKTRFYVPLTAILDAKVDVYKDTLENAINVDFKDAIEAENFEVPSWFGAEVMPGLMKDTKIKRKSK